MDKQKLFRVEMRVTSTVHFDVPADSDGEARELARAKVQKGEYCQAPPHKLKVKIVAVDELQSRSDTAPAPL
jgi:hypothetical protein